MSHTQPNTPSGARHEPGRLVGGTRALNTVRAASDFGREPPRMIVALHDSPKDLPEHTAFRRDGSIVHELESPWSAALRAILDYVRKGLGVDLDALWSTQRSQFDLWGDPASLDERWARRYSERFFYVGAGGPGQVYADDEEWDAPLLERARDPDPAIPIACTDRHLARYAAVTRGLSVLDPLSSPRVVLRVSKDAAAKARHPALAPGRLVQTFDTQGHVHLPALEAQSGCGLIARAAGGGTFDGNAIPLPRGPDLDPMKSAPPASAEARRLALGALERARPVGLCRLALTLRRELPREALSGLEESARASHGDPQKGDVLYVSRLLRMYGDAPEQSFYLSRLLWSLRTTPCFTDVQAWWFVFHPRGALARSMWAPGARSVTVGMREQATSQPGRHGVDYRLSHVITNHGSEAPDRAGRSWFWCRIRPSLAGGIASPLHAEGWRPPREAWKIVEGHAATAEYIAPWIRGDIVPEGDDGEDGAIPGWRWFRS